MLNSSKVSFWEDHFFEGFAPPEEPTNLVRTIVSQTFFYIVSLKFQCWAVQKFRFGEPFGGFVLSEDPKFGQNISLTYNFLHSEFQLSMLSSSKVLFWRFSPRRPPYLVKIFVSLTTSYIVSFNFQRQAVQNGPFWAHILGSPFTWGLKNKICKQPPIGFPFHQLSVFYIKRSRGN